MSMQYQNIAFYDKNIEYNIIVVFYRRNGTLIKKHISPTKTSYSNIQFKIVIMKTGENTS